MEYIDILGLLLLYLKCLLGGVDHHTYMVGSHRHRNTIGIEARISIVKQLSVLMDSENTFVLVVTYCRCFGVKGIYAILYRVVVAVTIQLYWSWIIYR